MTATHRTEPTDAAPATSAQQRLWLSDELGADRTANHIPVLYEATEAIDVAALQRALDDAVARHDSLGARYVLGDDGLEQLRTRGEPRIAVECASAEDDDEARAVIDAAVRREFDIERGPMLRAVVVALPDGRRFVLLVLHHLCIDDWSLRTVLGEIWAAYASPARPTGEAPEPYFDYARRERRWLESPQAASRLESLVEALGTVPGTVPLPARAEDAAAAPHGTEGTLHTATLSPQELEALERACGQLGCTRFVMMFAVYAALVQRVSGMSDFLVAIPVANRDLQDMDTVGLFTNIVPAVVTSASTGSLPDLVRARRTAVLDALDRQAVPFDQVARRLSPPGRASRFCNVSFGMGEDYPREPAPGLRRLPYEGYAPVRYDLAGYVTSGSDATTLSLFSDPRVVADDDARSWLDLWRDLVRSPEDLVKAGG